MNGFLKHQEGGPLFSKVNLPKHYEKESFRKGGWGTIGSDMGLSLSDIPINLCDILL